jgi:hypothetical protein
MRGSTSEQARWGRLQSASSGAVRRSKEGAPRSLEKLLIIREGFHGYAVSSPKLGAFDLSPAYESMVRGRRGYVDDDGTGNFLCAQCFYAAPRERIRLDPHSDLVGHDLRYCYDLLLVSGSGHTSRSKRPAHPGRNRWHLFYFGILSCE